MSWGGGALPAAKTESGPDSDSDSDSGSGGHGAAGAGVSAENIMNQFSGVSCK